MPRASSAEPAGKQLLPPVPEPEQDHAGTADDIQPVHTSDHIAGGYKRSRLEKSICTSISSGTVCLPHLGEESLQEEAAGPAARV